MTLRGPSLLMALTAALSLAPAAHAEQYGIDKGKAAASPCSLVYDVGDGTTLTLKGKKRIVGCADGSACDKDGSKNGSCTFEVDVCAAQVAEGCTAEPTTLIKPVAKAKKLLGLVPPAVGVTEPTCGTPGSIVIPLKGKNKDKSSPLGKGKLGLKTKITSGSGNNTLFLQCNPCTGDSCGPLPGGATCAPRESGLPTQLNLTVPDQINITDPIQRSDLDNGFSGDSHNFPVTALSTLKFCLTDCDATTDSLCQGSGSTGAVGDSLNGPTFGAPLPLLANNVPVCVINRYANSSINTTYDLVTGELNGLVNLLSDVYVQTPSDQVCPRCSGASFGDTGTCQSGARQGQSCTVDGIVKVDGSAGNPIYNLSTQCLPDTVKRAATLVIDLPLTTGESRKDGSKPCPGQTVDDGCAGGTCTVDCSGTTPAKGGINQTCCSSNPTKPCFPTAADSPPGAIIRNGTTSVATPVWPDPTYPKTSTSAGRAAAVFCEAKTNDPTVDILSGLAGPGALLLPYNTEITATP